MNDPIFLMENDWTVGALVASTCEQFKEDVEEECIAQEVISCFNCRFRRFVKDGIVCTQKGGRRK